ncbi:energy transducer TonB [Kordia sp. YSTF-M3]|uniref:Energy transducer TonB n=1 Tax=Kordia aestuariivivens TaxID=2759037 RepID=A0ABR7Q3G2_9FLAO|nr:energy transducer TonB [Kordia aestuariivivens]MBC8753086.1 energy transducer TonB [Kordia aestuariivivens]
MKNVNYTENVNATGVHESHLAKKNDLKIQRSPLLRFSVSLALSLFIVYTLFQVETATAKTEAVDVAILEDDVAYVEPFTPEEVKVVEKLKPEPLVEKQIIADELKEVPDDTKLKATVLETSTTPKEVTKDFDPNAVDVADTEEVIEEVPFAFVEFAPIFPGCEKYTSKAKRKKCMSEKIQKHVNRKFDTGLAEELGLDEGVKRIDVFFMIDENGNVAGIQSRAPHPKLQKEAERVIKLLPKMEPGKQQNKSVKVKYTLPIVFRVN